MGIVALPRGSHRAVAAWHAIVVCGTILSCAGASSASSPRGLEIVPASISKIQMLVGCGETPAPGPPRVCPPSAYLEIKVIGRHCSGADFELRVRQHERTQDVTIYKRTGGSCMIGAINPKRLFSTIFLSSYEIDPEKPLRLLNPLPVLVQPAP